MMIVLAVLLTTVIVSNICFNYFNSSNKTYQDAINSQDEYIKLLEESIEIKDKLIKEIMEK